jgi:hypothetical protein
MDTDNIWGGEGPKRAVQTRSDMQRLWNGKHFILKIRLFNLMPLTVTEQEQKPLISQEHDFTLIQLMDCFTAFGNT